MEGVRDVLVVLQPVARHDGAAAGADAAVVGFDHLAGIETLEAFIARQHRLFVRRPHIGEDQAVAFLNRIPGLAHAIALEPAFRLARLVEAAPLRIEQPAVVTAANAALLDPAIVERGSAMTAACLHQPRVAAPVAE